MKKIKGLMILGLALCFLVVFPGISGISSANDSLEDKNLLLPAVVATGLSILFLDEEVQKFSQRNRMDIEDTGTMIQHGFTAMFPVFATFGYIGGNEKAQLASRALLRGIVVNTITTAGLKEAFGRIRPIYGEGAHEFRPFSGNRALPSGHTSHSFTVATVLSEIYGEEHRWVPIVAYGAAGFVGYSRLDGNKHWLSDVILGAAIGHVIGKWAVSKEKRIITPVTFDNGRGIGLKAEFRF